MYVSVKMKQKCQLKCNFAHSRLFDQRIFDPDIISTGGNFAVSMRKLQKDIKRTHAHTFNCIYVMKVKKEKIKFSNPHPFLLVV